MTTWHLKDSIGGQFGGGLSPFTSDLGNSPFTCDLVVAGFVCWGDVTCSITDDAGLTYLPLTTYKINDVFVQFFWAHGSSLSIPSHNNITYTAATTSNRVEFFTDFYTGSYIPAPLQIETGHAEGTGDASITLGPVTPDGAETLSYWLGATAVASTGTNGANIWPTVTDPSGTIVDGANPSFFRGGYNYDIGYIQPFGSFPSPMSYTFGGWTASVSAAFAIVVFRSTDYVPPVASGFSYSEIF